MLQPSQKPKIKHLNLVHWRRRSRRSPAGSRVSAAPVAPSPGRTHPPTGRAPPRRARPADSVGVTTGQVTASQRARVAAGGGRQWLVVACGAAGEARKAAFERALQPAAEKDAVLGYDERLRAGRGLERTRSKAAHGRLRM